MRTDFSRRGQPHCMAVLYPLRDGGGASSVNVLVPGIHLASRHVCACVKMHPPLFFLQSLPFSNRTHSRLGDKLTPISSNLSRKRDLGSERVKRTTFFKISSLVITFYFPAQLASLFYARRSYCSGQDVVATGVHPPPPCIRCCTHA